MIWFLKVATIATGIMLVIAFTSIPILNHIVSVAKKSQVQINNQIIVAEVVSSLEDIEMGLSGRDAIGINEGMLFIFAEKDRHIFWMKDMKFPIDIIWISGNVIVGVEEGLMPEIGVPDHRLTIYVPLLPVDKVLEVMAGRADILQAKIGDKVVVRSILSL